MIISLTVRPSSVIVATENRRTERTQLAATTDRRQPRAERVRTATTFQFQEACVKTEDHR